MHVNAAVHPHDAMSNLQTALITDEEGFCALGEEWRSLWGETALSGSVFGSFDWYSCWWKHFGDGGKSLFVIVVREGERLVAVAPLMLENGRLRGVPARIVRFMENGNSLHNDFVLATGKSRPLLDAILECLLNHRDRWDMAEFKNISDDSESGPFLLDLAEKRGITCGVRPALDSPYINIRCDWDEFYATCTPRTRKTHRNLLNSIDKAGELQLLRIVTAEEYEIHRASLLDVAANCWTARVGDSIATPRNRDFFDDLARGAAERGWLDIWLLLLNGRVIAFEYHLRCNGRDHALRASYHEEFAHLSPGAVLDLLVMKELFHDHAETHEYDLGGSFDPYKKKWTPAVRKHKMIHMFKSQPYSRLLYGIEYGVIPLLKNARTAIARLRSGEIHQ